jgi:hypothetical protein
MQQRADDVPERIQIRPTPVQVHTRDEQGLSTADLAATRPTEMQPTDEPPKNVTPIGERTGQPVVSSTAGSSSHTALFGGEESDHFRSRWTEIQAGFVDEPRRAVEHADELVASTIKRLAEMFADERSKLERHWDKGDDISTEDLRLALQRYRSFFDRLLNI